MLVVLGTLLSGVPLHAQATPSCPTGVLSCSSSISSNQVDPCCVPSPAGLFLLKQRFEPDVEVEGGKWGIEGLEVLQCDGTPSSQTYTSTRTHEEIASCCLQSKILGSEKGFQQAENVWAQSEVGEGVEEVWERAWNTAGRYISTFSDRCDSSNNHEENVPAFFYALNQLHDTLSTHRLLTEQDITPADDTSYSLSNIQEALSLSGYHPIVVCDNLTLAEVHWPFVVQGKFQSAKFEPTTLERSSNCPAEGIIYPPSQSLPTPSSVTWDPLLRPTPRPITLSHDESRMYYTAGSDEDGGRENPKKLGLFKLGDAEREERKGERADKRFLRDEL